MSRARPARTSPRPFGKPAWSRPGPRTSTSPSRTPQRAPCIQPGHWPLLKGMPPRTPSTSPTRRTGSPRARRSVRSLWASETSRCCRSPPGYSGRGLREGGEGPRVDRASGRGGRQRGVALPLDLRVPQEVTASERLSEMVAHDGSVLEEAGIPSDDWQHPDRSRRSWRARSTGRPDRAKVARVILNRLDDGPPNSGLLQMGLHRALRREATRSSGNHGRAAGRRTARTTPTRCRGCRPAPSATPARRPSRRRSDRRTAAWHFFVTVDPSTGRRGSRSPRRSTTATSRSSQAWCSANPVASAESRGPRLPIAHSLSPVLPRGLHRGGTGRLGVRGARGRRAGSPAVPRRPRRGVAWPVLDHALKEVAVGLATSVDEVARHQGGQHPRPRDDGGWNDEYRRPRPGPCAAPHLPPVPPRPWSWERELPRARSSRSRVSACRPSPSARGTRPNAADLLTWALDLASVSSAARSPPLAPGGRVTTRSSCRPCRPPLARWSPGRCRTSTAASSSTSCMRVADPLAPGDGAGMTVVSGLDMLVHQAGEQFRLFTGHEAPWRRWPPRGVPSWRRR